MFSFRGFALACLLLCFTTGYSQGGRQQGQNRQQGQQQQRQNRIDQMADAAIKAANQNLAAQADPLVLIYRKDVQRDLGLELGPRNRFDNLRDQQARAMQQAQVQNRRNRTNTVADLLKAQRAETQEKIDELLTKEQKARLKEIAMQLQGGGSLLNGNIQKQLGLDEDQIARIEQIRVTRDQQLAALGQQVATGAIRPQFVNAEVTRIQNAMSASMNEVLTEDQKVALVKIVGRTFKPDQA